MPLKDGPLERWIRSEGEKVGKNNTLKIHEKKLCIQLDRAEKADKLRKKNKQTKNHSHIANQNKQVNTKSRNIPIRFTFLSKQ